MDQYEQRAMDIEAIETTLIPCMPESRILASNWGSDVVKALDQLARASFELVVAGLAAREGLRALNLAAHPELKRRIALATPDHYEHSTAALLAMGQVSALERALHVVGRVWVTQDALDRVRRERPRNQPISHEVDVKKLRTWLRPSADGGTGKVWVRHLKEIFAIPLPAVISDSLEDLLSIRLPATHANAGEVPNLSLWRAATWSEASSVLAMILMGRLADRDVTDVPIGVRSLPGCATR